MGCASSSPKNAVMPPTPPTPHSEEMRRREALQQKSAEDRAQEMMAREAESISRRARPMIEARTSCENLDMYLGTSSAPLKIDENSPTQNFAALKIQKQMRRKQALMEAEAEQKWMLFSNLDHFDEAEMVKLAIFMENAMKKVAETSPSVIDAPSSASEVQRHLNEQLEGDSLFSSASSTSHAITTNSREQQQASSPIPITDVARSLSEPTLIKKDSVGVPEEDRIKFKRELSVDKLIKAGAGRIIISPASSSRSSHDGSVEDADGNSGKSAGGGGGPASAREKERKEEERGGAGGRGQRDFDLPSGFVTPAVARAIIDVYKQGGKLSTKGVHKLLRLSYRMMQTLPNTTVMQVGPSDKLTVVGDIHGQLHDLFHILQESGLPYKYSKYIFNGDFVDRGPFGVEVMCVLLSLFLAFPGQVALNRGNHEDFTICAMYGFKNECASKYDEVTFGMFVEIFQHLPLFALINDAVFVLHGGLFHTGDVLLSELNAIDRKSFSLSKGPQVDDPTAQIPRFRRDDFLKQLQIDALWSDPCATLGLGESPRGAGVHFGPDICRTFLETNNWKMVVRSHECVRTGFDFPFSGEDQKLIATIFSASNYCGNGNSAAYMVFTNTSGEFSKDLTATRVGGGNLQYSIHYFHLDPEEQQGFGASNGEGGGGNMGTSDGDNFSSPEQLSLDALIFKKKYLLFEAFEFADMAGNNNQPTGYVSKIAWAETMQKVLGLHIRWMSMIPVLVTEDCYLKEVHHDGSSSSNEQKINYKTFLDNFCVGSLEIDDTVVADGSYITCEEETEEAETSASTSETERASVGSRESFTQPSRRKSNNLSPATVNSHVVEALYAHHHELMAVFQFFDKVLSNLFVSTSYLYLFLLPAYSLEPQHTNNKKCSHHSLIITSFQGPRRENFARRVSRGLRHFEPSRWYHPYSFHFLFVLSASSSLLLKQQQQQQ